MKEFIHLHVHTEYSLLDGLARIKKLVKMVKERGWRAIAITDHGNMFGTLKFFEECVTAGIKPIIGEEFYICHDMKSKEKDDRGHLVLLAKNMTGYQNLLKLSSYSYLDGMYYKARIDYDLLEKHSEGLICLSACVAGHIPQYILKGQDSEAEKLALKLKNMFGEDFYLEIQDHGMEEQKVVLLKLAQMSEKLNIPLVATNDVHYLYKEDAELQDVLMCVQMGKTIDDPDRLKFDTDQLYLKDYDEMFQALPGFEEALDRTVEIADKIEILPIKTKSLREAAEGGCSLVPDQCKLGAADNFIPVYDPGTGETTYEYLSRLAWEGFKRIYTNPPQEYYDRMNMELETIHKLGYVEYFLVVWDYINFARENDIPVGPGRGSGAGSLVAYCTGITQVDPMRYDLFFDRFINPERVSMPDFDVDFCMDRRREVIEYSKRKYGADHVSNIVTFGNMQAKNAIKDVARVLRYPYSEVDKITKEIPGKPTHKPPCLKYYFGTTGDPADEQYIIPELRKMYESDDEVKRIADMAIKLEGVPRNMSMHAAGVLIAPDPVYEHVPMAKSGEDVVTQFDMIELEHLGLLKFDFLGLRTLTDIHKTIKYVKENHGVEIDFTKMSYDDPKVFELISSGNTEAVFQLESGGMKKFMKELQPTSLEDIIAGISLYRPGPMDFIPKFIKGKRNPEQIEYDDPCLVDILKNSYGCIVYQEQVMKIFQVMAGFTLGGADNVRRIMSKKKPEKLPPEKQKFIYGGVNPNGTKIPGAVELGHDPVVAERVFEYMAKFAGYAFNKSHAAAYAYVSYQTGYLKAHYEIEYLTAVLNNRINNIDTIKKYTNYARKEGFEVYPPDINKSITEFKTENGNMRFGLGAIKGVGTGLIDLIVEERNKNGEFKSFEDFAKRAPAGAMNKKAMESLIYAGAFDCFGHTRSQLIEVYPAVMDMVNSDRKAKASGQFSMFDAFEEATETINKVEYPNIKEYNKEALLKYEKDYVGIYLSGHPLDDYLAKYDEFNFTSDMLPEDTGDEFGGEGGEVEETPMFNFADEEGEELHAEEELVKDGMQVTCGGIIKAIKKITKGANTMAFLTIEDVYGNFDVSLFNKQFARFKDLVEEDKMVTIRGKISIREGKSPCVIADSIIPWDKQEEVAKQEKTVYLRFDTKNLDLYNRVRNIASSYAGDCPIIIKCTSSNKAFAFNAKVDPNNYLVNELIGLLGEENVIVR